MKDCERCRFLNSGFHGEGICDFFGEDLPKWAERIDNDSGCLLKCQEVKKAIDLVNNFRQYGTGNKLDEFGFPEFTEEDKKHNEKADREYNKYIETLKKRCKERLNK